jgi:hypothetical protein
MKYLTIILALISISAFSQEVPKYLQDGVITVTLKSGKVFTYSANEYAVVRRGSKKPEVKIELAEAVPTKAPAKEAPKRNKHIISGEIVSSNSGDLDVNKGASKVDVESKRELGLGLQYQYNFVDDLYGGVRVDTNGGAAANIGVGF